MVRVAARGQRGIAEALALAGASAGDPVMLVGHSQGGMVAAQAAADSASGAFAYNVIHVLTAGSPIGLADVPDDVQVLALENNNDVVPHLDSTDNPRSPNVTSVTVYGTWQTEPLQSVNRDYGLLSDVEIADLEERYGPPSRLSRQALTTIGRTGCSTLRPLPGVETSASRRPSARPCAMRGCARAVACADRPADGRSSGASAARTA